MRQLSKYDLNDSQLTTQQSSLNSDMAIHLGIVNANHWDMAYVLECLDFCLTPLADI